MTAIRHPGSLLKELDLDKAQFLALVSRPPSSSAPRPKAPSGSGWRAGRSH